MTDNDSLGPRRVGVTIAILTKNPGPSFKEVLAAIQSQELPIPYEILVIDSGSTDGTAEYLETRPDIRLVRIKADEFGHGKTRNLAVLLANGQYVAMLTQDAKPANTRWLANLIAPLDADPSVAGVFGRHIAYEKDNLWIRRDLDAHFDYLSRWPAVMGIEDRQRFEHDLRYRQMLHFFSDNNACLRKSVWEHIPYAEVDFAEDQLWAKSILEAGYKRAYANEAIVFHSHDYSVFDTFRRSFDESRALKGLFGYDLCGGILRGFYQVAAGIRRHIGYFLASGALVDAVRNAPRIFALNIARQAGFYIGSHEGSVQGPLFRLFSLDDKRKRS